MGTFRTLGLVVGGMVIGVGLTVGGSRVGAQTAAQAVTPRADTPSARIVMSPLEYAGAYPFRFFLDTATGTCYLAGIGNAQQVTALTATAATACSRAR
jgi:hypothetical protein